MMKRFNLRNCAKCGIALLFFGVLLLGERVLFAKVIIPAPPPPPQAPITLTGFIPPPGPAVPPNSSEKPDSPTFYDSVPPSTPSGLTVAAVSVSEIDLSWQPATDDVIVAGYKIYRNGGLVGISYSTSYFDGGLAPSTAYTYKVSAYDAAGNKSGQSSGVSATTLTPDTTAPTVTITGPNNGDTLSGTVDITVNASDDVGIAYVNFMMDGVLIGKVYTSPYTFSFNTTLVANGSHTLSVFAYDTSGNVSNESRVLLDISNEGNVIYCNNDGLCDGNETHLSCPNDCPVNNGGGGGGGEQQPPPATM